MKNRKLEELIYRYEEAIADNKTPYLDASEYSVIASYYWTEKRDEDAKKAIENGLRIHPGNDDILRIQIEFLIDDGYMTEARGLIDNLLSNPSIEIQFLNAELYYEEGDREQALSILDNLYEINTDPDVYIDMAELYNDMDEKERALDCLKIADKIAPEDQETQQLMISILTELGKYNELINLCNKIIDKDPYSFFAWFKLAECYSALAEYDKAIEAAEFAMIANPESEVPYFLRGQSFIALENYEKALQDMLHIMDSTIIPSYYLHYYIGICQIYLNNYEEALENLKISEANIGKFDEPLNHYIISNISSCLYELGRTEEAKIYEQKLSFYTNSNIENIYELEEMVTLEPNAENWYNLGVTYLDNKLFEKAVYALEKAQESDPELNGLALCLLLAYVGNHDKKKIMENINSISNNLKKIDPAFKMDTSDEQIDRIIEKIHEMFSSFFSSTDLKNGDNNNDKDSDDN